VLALHRIDIFWTLLAWVSLMAFKQMMILWELKAPRELFDALCEVGAQFALR
jgi:hypothetical protein